VPHDWLFRAFYWLGLVALAIVIPVGIYVALDDLRERREGEGDGQD